VLDDGLIPQAARAALAAERPAIQRKSRRVRPDDVLVIPFLSLIKLFNYL
jgi:hypothetical protein